MDGSHSLLFRSDSSLALRWDFAPAAGLSPIKSGTSCTSMSLVIRSRDSQETLLSLGREALSRRAMGAQAHAGAAPPYRRGSAAPRACRHRPQPARPLPVSIVHTFTLPPH